MRHLELFAGIGGFRMAMEHLQLDGIMEFQNIAFSEIDKHATTTYKANFDTTHEIEIGDIVEFTKDRERINNLPNFEILTGGFPCQSFSLMGFQKGFEDERGQLFFRIMDIVRIKHPKYLLLENVKNLFTHNKGETLKCIIQALRSEGYVVKYDIFDTADFMLPQTRKRILIFATLCDNADFEFNAEVVKECFNERRNGMSIRQVTNVLGVLDKTVPSKYLLSEKIKPTILSDGSANFKSKSEINKLIARPLTATMHKMHRACQDNYYSIDFIQSDGKINPALTMTKEELSKIPIRKLTPKEALMIQGFPEDFAPNAQNAGICDGALYKQAGNAVSVNTIYAVLYYLITNNIIHN